MILHADHYFLLKGKPWHQWMDACCELSEKDRKDVYIKAAWLGRKDVVQRLAPTFHTQRFHSDPMLAAVVNRQFECADWIEQNTPIDMFDIEYIFNNASSFIFEIAGECLGGDNGFVSNDKPFFQAWVEHQEFEKCRAQRKMIETHLTTSNTVYVNRKM